MPVGVEKQYHSAGLEDTPLLRVSQPVVEKSVCEISAEDEVEGIGLRAGILAVHFENLCIKSCSPDVVAHRFQHLSRPVNTGDVVTGP